MTLHTSYRDFVDTTAEFGSKVSSRYGFTRELLNRTFVIASHKYPERPRLNPKIGMIEGLFLVGGFFDLEAIKLAAPNADHSLFTLNGAYGPRVNRQLIDLVDHMSRDMYGRQHVLYVGSPGDQYQPDTPCTNTLQFFIRDGVVHVTAMMRSSDVIKGLPTDVIQFGVLCQVVAHCLALVPGYVTVLAGSSHVYESDLDRVPVNDLQGTIGVQDMFAGEPLQRLEAYRKWSRNAVTDLAERGRNGGIYYARGVPL